LVVDEIWGEVEGVHLDGGKEYHSALPRRWRRDLLHYPAAAAYAYPEC